MIYLGKTSGTCLRLSEGSGSATEGETQVCNIAAVLDNSLPRRYNTGDGPCQQAVPGDKRAEKETAQQANALMAALQ